MLFKKLLAIAALLVAPLSQAAFVTINDAAMDAVFSQASFQGNNIDIRIGAVTNIVQPDLLDISTPSRLTSLFNLHVGPANVVNFYYVDTISECGGFNPNIIGCGETPGQDFVVESIWATGNGLGAAWGVQLLAHELGHNLGLNHNNGNFLMNPSINGFTTLEPFEVAAIFQSPLVQRDDSGYFIQINPVLILAQQIQTDVPEPSTMVLMLSGLLVLGAARRRRQPAAH